MALPQLFVIGDSISIYYGPYLERLLQGTFRYTRKTGEEAMRNLDIPLGANGGDSSMVLEYLSALAATGDFHPDYLMINCGLHDIKVDPVTGQRQVTLDRYRENLHKILAIAADFDSRVVWVRTTPVFDARHNYIQRRWFHRFQADVEAYNAAADEIMEQRRVPVIDLHGFTQRLGGYLFRDHVHYTPRACECQAAYLAGALTALIRQAAEHI